MAIKVLHTCSSTTVRIFLSNYEVILNPRQIKFVFDKDPELFMFYLNYYKTLTGNAFVHDNLSKYVALRNPKVWLHLQEEGTIGSVTLGYRTSKKFIRYNKRDFIKNIKYHSHFLRLDVMVDELREHFMEVYLDFFPKDKSNISAENFCHRLLRNYPKRKQWNVFEQTFKKVFKSPIMNNLVCLNHNFIQLFADKSITKQWAEVLYQRDKCNYVLKYCDPKTAIPLLTEKLNDTSSTQERIELVGLLLENCAEDEDFKSLEEVLSLICIKYLNEKISGKTKNNNDLLCQILHKIVIVFKLEQFTEKHWISLNKILALARKADATDFYYFTDIFFCDLKYIEYLCIQNKLFRNELRTFINEIEANKTWFYIDLENPKIQRKIWVEIIKTYPNVISANNKARTNFINNIIDFNEKNQEYRIDLSNFPDLQTYLNSLFNRDIKTLEHSQQSLMEKVIIYNYKFPSSPLLKLKDDKILEILREDKYFAWENAVVEMITKKNRSQFENKVLQMLWENNLECHYINEKAIHWFLINEPNTIVPYFNKILEINKNFIDIPYIKLMSHFDFDTKVKCYCIKKLDYVDTFLKSPPKKRISAASSEDFTKKFKKKTDFDELARIIEILSILLSTSEYIAVFKRFLPTKHGRKNTEESLNLYFLQCEIAKNFKNLEEPETSLPVLMQFLLGDYLTAAVPSLHSIGYRTSENSLYPYVNQLFKAEESVKLHAFFLSCELLNFSYVFKALLKANETTFCRKHVFIKTMKYFQKNSPEEMLNIITMNLNKYDIVDLDMQCDCVQICWYFFENLRKKQVNVQFYLQFILDIIINSDEDLLLFLPEDFCRNIISNYFKDPPERDRFLHNIYVFVCVVLIKQKSEQYYNFKFVFDIISEFKKTDNIEAIKIFFYNFYDIALQNLYNVPKTEVNNYHIELFKQHWFYIFTYAKMFDECVLLNLLFFRSFSFDKIVESYAQDVVTYLQQLVAELGPSIYDKVKNLLLYKHPLTEEEIYLFYYNILLQDSCPMNCLLVLDVLDPHCSDEAKEIYLKIIGILKQSKDRAVSSRLKIVEKTG